jgi:hypothetical protein
MFEKLRAAFGNDHPLGLGAGQHGEGQNPLTCSLVGLAEALLL